MTMPQQFSTAEQIRSYFLELTYHLHWNFDALLTKIILSILWCITSIKYFAVKHVQAHFAVHVLASAGHSLLKHMYTVVCSVAWSATTSMQPHIMTKHTWPQFTATVGNVPCMHSVLVSAALGHFVWSHQWHQICTAERQPLVGGRQGREQQQWPEALSLIVFLFTYSVPTQSVFPCWNTFCVL